MEKTKEMTRLPATWRVFSGSTLKMLAVISMLIDHTAIAFLYDCPSDAQTILIIGGRVLTWYRLLRWIGRLAFPIFCFLLTEGFLHTRGRKKYGGNLLLFAILSEIPWNLFHGGSLLYSHTQNVLFTLLLGFLGLCALERISGRGERLLALAVLAVIAYFLNADYGVGGYVLILLFYLLRDRPLPRALSLCCVLQNTWGAWLAAIPIGLYNGRRGFLQGAVGKYLFYGIYPVHMLLLYLLRRRFGG